MDQKIGRRAERASEPAITHAFFDRARARLTLDVPPGPQTDTVHVETDAEREQSFFNRIKGSNDPTDLRDYIRQFPNGAHKGEVAVMLRRLGPGKRTPEAVLPPYLVNNTFPSATPPAEGSAQPAQRVSASAPPAEGSALPAQRASANPATRRAFSITPGTFASYATSTLQPGTTLRGKLVLERNGDFLYTGSNGVKVRGRLDFSAPDRVTGTATVTQPKVLGVPLVRYPDGSSSTSMTIRAQIVDGKLQGQYSDRFETGVLVADLNNPL